MYLIISIYVKLIFIILFLSVNFLFAQSNFMLGNESLINDELEQIRYKKVAIIMNHTSVLQNGTSLLDTLISLKICDIVTIFTPEHDLFGNIEAGKLINSMNKSFNGIPIKSLYSKNKKPTSDDIVDADVFLFDIQDIGARFYTYISTLYYCIESAAENGKKILVADRPNLIGGARYDGPLLDDNFKSFIGIDNIPVIYGMTIGELAQFFNESLFNKIGKKAELEILKMQNYNRTFDPKIYFENWRKLSPNIPNFETAQIYPATCFIEGTNISEGRGTDKPFLQIGAPFINPGDLVKELVNIGFAGIDFEETEFIPISMEAAAKPKFQDQKCYGVKFTVKDHNLLDHMSLMICLIESLVKLYPDQIKFRENHFNLLAGNDSLLSNIKKGISPEIIKISWEKDLEKFNEKREKYLLY